MSGLEQTRMAHNLNPVKLEGVDASYQLNPNN